MGKVEGINFRASGGLQGQLVVRRMGRIGREKRRRALDKWKGFTAKQRKFGRIALRYLGEKSVKVGLERWKRWVAGERRKEDRGRRGVHLRSD